MPLDGIFLGAVTAQLQVLAGGRIDRIVQPEGDEIVMTIRSGGENHRLLLSASPNHARIHLTRINKANPSTPPNLCLLLRRRLLGGRVRQVKQVAGDRIACVTVESADEMGDITEKRLILEIMGRHSNLMLVDAQGKILDAARHVPPSMSRVRQVMPGLPYQQPPGQQRADPKTLDAAALFALLEGAPEPLPKALQARINGLSPASAQELAHLAATHAAPASLSPGELEAACRGMEPFLRRLRQGDWQPLLITRQGIPAEVLPFPYATQAGEVEFFSASEALEQYFEGRDRAQRQAQRSTGLRQTLTTLLERNRRKQQVLQETLLAGQNREESRILGELLTAQLWRIQPGDRFADLEDYYTGETRRVELDIRLSPAENAQRHFKRYQKLKTASVAAAGQLEEALREEVYLESLMHSAETCDTEEELAEIRQEMAAAGYLKLKTRGKQKQQPSKPLRFTASDGSEIWVGRNNLQNDALTFKTAAKTDLWLHAKDMPGSHVILRVKGALPTPEVQREAAILAAWYSKGRQGGNVPVDIAPVRHVRKPAGARPGYVIYDHQRTLYVTPGSEIHRFPGAK